MGVASKKKQFGINFIIHLVLIVLVVICLAPIALVVINSFKTNTEIVMLVKIIRPPIVGVPCFFKCAWGPSSRTCWPNFNL